VSRIAARSGFAGALATAATEPRSTESSRTVPGGVSTPMREAAVMERRGTVVGAPLSRAPSAVHAIDRAAQIVTMARTDVILS
jgi:hypothetical protein